MLDEILLKMISGVSLIEEEFGTVNRILAMQAGAYALSLGKEVCYLTSEESGSSQKDQPMLPPTGAQKQLPENGGSKTSSVVIGSGASLSFLKKMSFDVAVFPYFSNYIFGKSEVEIIEAMRAIRNIALSGRGFVVALETPILSRQNLAFLRSVSDNVLIIQVSINADRITRMLYVPKLKGTLPMDKLLKFTMEEDGIQIDTRELVG